MAHSVGALWGERCLGYAHCHGDPNKYTLHLSSKLLFQVLLLNGHNFIRVLPGLLCLQSLATPLASVGSLLGWRVVRAIVVCLLPVNMAGRDQECPGGADSNAQPTCSGVVQSADAFMKALGAY